MGAIFNLLEKHRLQHFYNQFLQLGVKDERDFIDGITEEDLTNLGLSQVEKNRFSTMKKSIGRFRAPMDLTAAPVQKTTKSFSLQYTYPKCPEPKCIKDMDPAQNTVEDLMLRICHLESVPSSQRVCLYSSDGMPLTDDPFFNTWSLQERHIASGDVIYAIFTPKENLHTGVVSSGESNQWNQICGTDTVRCHIMLKGDFELHMDLEKHTISDLKKQLSNESGIPAHVLHYTGQSGSGSTLESCGISEGSTVNFSLSSFTSELPNSTAFFLDDIKPSVQQTPIGMSTLLSSLYIIIAVVEGLYNLFRELLPKCSKERGEKTVEDLDVFEHSAYCWAYLLSEAKKETSDHENYGPCSLISEESIRFREPVNVPGVPGALERAVVLQKIKDGEKIPNCTEEVLKEMSLKRDTHTEKILLSTHPSISTYHLWISHESVTAKNFDINTGKTFGDMAKELEAYPLLRATPPMRLKDLGYQDPCLVSLSEDNLAVYMHKDKLKPAEIVVYNCLSGKLQHVDVDILAARAGDLRDDHSFVITRTPKEAILVLIDTSSSMAENCYGSVDIQKIHAVKELFDNFATRTMAYDFHHIIGLVQFNSEVKTLHTFTETLEKFKEHVHTLKPSGNTKLYDALLHGKHELEKVKKDFPDCRLRILCLTDGNDVRSTNKPVPVAVSLIRSNIILDSILLGKVDNNFLHGISIATGGCCFKPETSKDGLKLFETETVLSLEMRKPKDKADPSSITESLLKGFFATHGYDQCPKAILPSQMQNKVTVTEKVLKKRIQESKDGRFMDKDRRILEEMKSLHCNPHPFFTVFPSESDFTFWKIIMEGPPETPYEEGTFELFCQFGPDYPVKPPTVRFVTHIYHCNINNVGRICHNIFDRNYNAQITMRDIFDAVFGLLIVPEPEDPLDSILAEEFLTSKEVYEQEAKKHTEKTAGESLDNMEKKLVEPETQFVPSHLKCPLSKRIFVDPVKTKYGTVYERKAIEKHLKSSRYDPFAGEKKLLRRTDYKKDRNMEKMVKDFRLNQIKETSV